MFATPIRLASAGQPGFWRRSIDELKRQSKIAVRLEGLHKPNQPFPLVRFEEESALGGCKVMSDADMGGFSKASLTHIPGTESIEGGESQSQPQAQSQSQSQSQEPQPNAVPTKPKRAQVRAACVACQRGKAKVSQTTADAGTHDLDPEQTLTS